MGPPKFFEIHFALDSWALPLAVFCDLRFKQFNILIGPVSLRWYWGAQQEEHEDDLNEIADAVLNLFHQEKE